jgi:DNA-binding CsgD family transcriptional regulator
LVRELVLAGTLARRAGMWGWHGGPVINGCVRELVASRLGRLDADEWDALTYLALGAPRTPGTLARLVGSRAVERLEDKGLLTCYGDAPYAEVVRAMCGPVRAARLSRTLAASVSGADAVRSAVWRLDGGLAAEPGLLAEACREAIAGEEVTLAVRLGRAAVDAGAGASGEKALTAALTLQEPRVPDDVPRLRDEDERLTTAILAGDLTAAPGTGADSGWDLAAAAYCGGLARLYRLRGNARDALAHAQDGVWRLPEGRTAFAGLCLGEVAHAAALLGDVAAARQALAEAAGRTLPAFRAQDVSAELAGPWVDAAAGDQAGAVRRALSAAGRADDPVAALFSLHDAVRLGAAEDATVPLSRLADDLGETALLARLFARHARACADDDGRALRGVAKEFEVLGLTLYAAEAQARAARAFHRAGEHRDARAAATTGWTLGRRCQGARTPALAALTAPELTLRQLEIARLAASGLSNRAIAERLTVSIRTVANHLCGAYERLGVNDRDGLARLLTGLDREVA